MTDQSNEENLGALLRRIRDALTSENRSDAQKALAALNHLVTEDALGEVSAPQSATDELPLEPPPRRANAMFLPRPAFLNEEDQWQINPSQEGGGWRAPHDRDQHTLEAVRATIKAEVAKEASILCPDDAMNTALRGYLSGDGLDEIDVYLGEPAYLPGVTIARVEVMGSFAGESVQAPGEAMPLEAFFNIRMKDGDLVAVSFDFTSDPLHQLNTDVQLRMIGHERDYLRYFLRIVHGDAGAFRVVDEGLFKRAQEFFAKSEDPFIPDDGKSFADLDWYDLRFLGFYPKGGIMFEAFVLYESSIFKAIFSVMHTGMVSMVFDMLRAREVDGLKE